MADDPGFPTNEDWPTWSYVNALAALTGDTVPDLGHITWTPTAPKQTPKDGKDATTFGAVSEQKGIEIGDIKWLMFDEAASGAHLDNSDPSTRNVPQDLAYYAWDEQYFGVNIDRNAIQAYEDTADNTTTFITDLQSLKHNDLDAYTLGDLRNNVVELQQVLSNKANDYRRLANGLKTSNSDFQGKAAAVIQERLEYYASALEHWRDQAHSTYGVDPADAIMDAWNAITGFVNAFNKIHQDAYNANIRNLIRNGVNQAASSVMQHMIDSGIVAGNPNYALGGYTKYYWTAGRLPVRIAVHVDPSKEEIAQKINEALSSYPMPNGGNGNLRDPATWDALNKWVGSAVVNWLNVFDQVARTALPSLNDAFVVLAKTLQALTDPTPFTPHAGSPNSLYNTNTPVSEFPPFNFNFGMPNTPPYDYNTPPYNYNTPPYNFNTPSDFYNSLGPPSGNGNQGPSGDFNVPSNLFDPTAHMLDGLNNLLDPTAHMFDGLNNLFDPTAHMFDGLNHLIPDGLIPNNLFDPTAHMLDGLGNLIPSNLLGNQPFSNPTDQLPDGQTVGPLGQLLDNGKPVLGPDGNLVGPDGKPLLGPEGELLGPGGKPLLGPKGELLGPDGKPLLGPHGELLGPDGQPLHGPHGEMLGPDGKPLLGPHGEILGPGGAPVTGPHGELLGPDGKPLIGKDGKPLTVESPSGLHGLAGLGGGPSHVPPVPALPGATATAGAGMHRLDPGRSLSGVPDVVGDPSQWSARQGDQSATVPAGPSESPGAPGTAGTAGTAGGMGGMPFMPPMGGGGMGGGSEKKERERQTWLSEDEKVWGTDVAAGMSVIGRPDDDEDEMDSEEVVLPLGPVRSRRPAPGRQQPPARTATSEGDEDDTVPRRG